MGDYLKVKSGNEIYYHLDRAPNAKASVLINHGFAEHLGRYNYLAKKLKQSGYNVYRYDLRGHGRSGLRRGHIDSYEDFLQDAEEMVGLIESHGEKNIFMLGHSMGGLITFLYGIKHEEGLRGQVFSGPAVGQLPSASGVRAPLFRMANKFFKNKKIKNPVSEDICSDPQVVKEYMEDPLVLKEATLNFYVEFLIEGTSYALSEIENYQYPCLITQGEMDRIVPKEIAKNLYNSISSKDKEIKIYENLYHEILNEKERDHVIKDIIEWLDNRV